MDKLLTLAICAVVLALLSCISNAHAGPIAELRGGDVVITVYSEDCKLTEVVTNLPRRATWAEGGKVFEGCASGTPFGVVMMYFTGDRTVAVAPLDSFKPLTSL